MHRMTSIRRRDGGTRLDRLRRWLLEEPAGPSRSARARIAVLLRTAPPH